MAKIYTDKNVLEAAFERYDIIFTKFNNIYLSVSAGKDSSVMLQLAARKAREHGKQFDVLFIDLEGQYQATIQHFEDLLDTYSDAIRQVYWVCLPISLRNAVSVLQPKWICWDQADKEKWIREMPENKWVINEENCPWNWFRHGMEFEEFTPQFGKWYAEHHGEFCACGVGIRSDESLNRFRTIISDSKIKWDGQPWTTQGKIGGKPYDLFQFFPLYDWRTEDIWGAVSRLNLLYNEIYELMYKNGLSIHEQRLCQPYGDDQRKGLDQFRALEPETWEKVLARVNGVNFGNIYARTSLLGNLTSEKPEHLTWEQYAVYLLESIGLYAPELEDHYYRKIKTFIGWWEKERGITAEQIEDYEDSKLESAGPDRKPSWRRIARAIEKNDFWMKRLSFSATKNDVEKLNALKAKYNSILGDGKADKDLQRWERGELCANKEIRR
jgi:predicted phosphoadenosine phosphosulfate sulfurtransferase